MNDKAPTYPTEVYKKDGITYVPHYRNATIFVGPGYPFTNKERYTAAELSAAGATKELGMLWSRGQHGEVSDLKP